MEICLEEQVLFCTHERNTCKLIEEVTKLTGFPEWSFYLLQNGKKPSHQVESWKRVHVVPRIVGGKGGFGSMLRAIGAQIEKTTNREACRDLSGRRLRDINEEQRLKNWIATQAEREKEAAEKKKKKLEKLCEQPKYEFKDDDYEKERQILPDLVEDAVAQGMKAAASGSGVKRKVEDTKPVLNKKKKLWLDDDIESDVSSSEDEESTTKASGPLVKA